MSSTQARGRGLPRRALRRQPPARRGHVGLPETRQDAGASCRCQKGHGAAAEVKERCGLLPRRGGIPVIRGGEGTRRHWRPGADGAVRNSRHADRRPLGRRVVVIFVYRGVLLVVFVEMSRRWRGGGGTPSTRRLRRRRDFSPDDGYRQSNLLGGDDLRATLKALARFHAHFSERRPGPDEKWRCGGHWQPALSAPRKASASGAWYDAAATPAASATVAISSGAPAKERAMSAAWEGPRIP